MCDASIHTLGGPAYLPLKLVFIYARTLTNGAIKKKKNKQKNATTISEA